MSARINLAPEVYQTSQRNKQRRKLATTIGTAVVVISVGFVGLMLLILGSQKVAIKAMTDDIKKKQTEISQISGLESAATAQQHLASWHQLSSNKTKASRFFEILETFVPQGIAVSHVAVNNTSTLETRASAKSYALVTKFVKALEAANIEIGPSASANGVPFFTNIQLTSATEDTGSVDFKLSTQMASEVTNGR